MPDSNAAAATIPRRGWRALRFLLVAASAVMAVWVALAIHPHPLFAYQVRRANVVLHARDPLPAGAGAMLDEVVRRVSRSPLYDPGRVHDVFLCDTQPLFTLFAPDARKVGGVSHTHLWGNVFLRPSDIARDRIRGYSGRETTGERTLTYFIAHEVTHAMTARHLGRLRYARLAAFQQEGYADHIAFRHVLDLRAGREAIRRHEPEMDTRRSGLYRRQELLVAYLLQRRGLTVDQLFVAPLNPRAVERELEADSGL
ncbi:MAG: hypothetical protein ABUL67_00305 [Haliangium ochraceum]